MIRIVIIQFHCSITSNDSLSTNPFKGVPGISSVSIEVYLHVKPDNPFKEVEKPSETTELIIFPLV